MTAYMSWEALTLEELRGFLHTYKVIYYETTQTICSDIESEFSRVETNSTSVIIRDLDPVAEYCVGVAASTVAGVGNYSQKHLPCKNYFKQVCILLANEFTYITFFTQYTQVPIFKYIFMEFLIALLG